MSGENDSGRITRRRRPVRERQVEWQFLYTPVALLIFQGLEQGHSCGEIGLMLGVTVRTVQRWAKKYGIETPRNFGRKRKPN